ncbi:hypothetical protein T05_11887 [Trichinella murrelli]|uniref:Uncharacterized protein n=1 Tax=Trichinella murrelli TaxID=144512 RepID=A0A0V0U5U6_9BILA|nr:hypothetical protein T05_11887 [Trichinella murrelli]
MFTSNATGSHCTISQFDQFADTSYSFGKIKITEKLIHYYRFLEIVLENKINSELITVDIFNQFGTTTESICDKFNENFRSRRQSGNVEATRTIYLKH